MFHRKDSKFAPAWHFFTLELIKVYWPIGYIPGGFIFWDSFTTHNHYQLPKVDVGLG
jgi:hypothetical protein